MSRFGEAKGAVTADLLTCLFGFFFSKDRAGAGAEGTTISTVGDQRAEGLGRGSNAPEGVEPAPGTSQGLGASPEAAAVAAVTLSPVAAARSHGFGGGGAPAVKKEIGEGKLSGAVYGARKRRRDCERSLRRAATWRRHPDLSPARAHL